MLNKHQILSLIILLLSSLGFYFFKASLGDFPDLQVYLHAAKMALTDPMLIYRSGPDLFLYPPVAAFFFIPLSSFTLPVTAALWYFFNVICIALLAIRLNPKGCLGFIALLILCRYWLINLRYGQVNIFILLLMMITHLALLKNHYKSAAFTLATATCLKLFSSLQVIEMFLLRKYKVVAMTIVVGIILLLVPILLWGPETYWQVMSDYPQQLLRKGSPLYSHNQSIGSILSAFLTDQQVLLFGTQSFVNWSVLSLSPSLVRILALIIGGALTALSWKRAMNRQMTVIGSWDALSAACFSFLFLSHLVWKPYFIFLLPPLVQLLGSQHRLRVLLPYFLIINLCASDGLKLFTLFTDFDPKFLSAWLDAAGLHFWAAIYLWWQWMKLERTRKVK